MEQIIIHIKDKQKARRLLKLLEVMDFVDSIEADETIINNKEETSQQENDDFFALAGIWQGRDINLKTIRQQAWPRQ